jgi:peroxiredoxin
MKTGDLIPPQKLEAISGEVVALPPSAGLVHLQFRRFAGCPICNLHLRSVVQRNDEIEAAGVREVVVFHSTERQLRKHEADLPLVVIADPDKRLYQEFGVERSVRALLSPRVWRTLVRALGASLWSTLRRRAPMAPLAPHGGTFGLPADLLIDAHGRVVAAKYGTHASDQWTVDELLDLASAARTDC